MHNQVAPFDQGNAHQSRQVGMFEIGRVVDAGREHHDLGIWPPVRGHALERGEQQVGIAIDGSNARAPERAREDTL